MSNRSQKNEEKLERLESPVREIAPEEAEAVQGGLLSSPEYFVVGQVRAPRPGGASFAMMDGSVR